MKLIIRRQKLIIFLYVLLVFLFCHHFIFRPVFLDWGASEAVQNLSFSGDVFTGGKKHTRAVLVEASREELWQWLIQLGQERGGFYSYTWLENLFGADMKNVFEIRKEFQSLRHVGDTIWLATKDHYRGSGYQVVAECVPLQSLVMVGGDDYKQILIGKKATGSWAFYLQPAGAGKTWLIARSSEGDISFGNRFLRYFIYEVPHFIMERKTLITIKELAENKT